MKETQDIVKKSVIPYQTLRARIRKDYGTISNWARPSNIPASELTRILKYRPAFVYANSAGYRVLRSLERDFGITPSDLGIQVLEVER